MDREATSRKAHYAEGALTLRDGHLIPGAEGLFNQALTNGLLVIAAANHLLPPAGERLPAARGLITLLAGVVDAKILTALDQAVLRTDAARHGRSTGATLTRPDVDALVELDRDPALGGSLMDVEVDRDWVRARAADGAEQDRAGEYLALLERELGEEEIERRAEAASGIGAPAPGDVGDGPQQCPVCQQETLAVTDTDDFGHGIGAGLCAVCSYWRGPDIVYWLGFDAEMDRLVQRDD